jgi:hypothetical protein
MMDTSNGFWSDGSSVAFVKNGERLTPSRIDGVVSMSIVNSRGFGCRLGLDNGVSVSVQWKYGNYCHNRYNEEPSEFSPDAEIAVFTPDGDWASLGTDTVQGWQTVDDVMNIISHFRANPSEPYGDN